MEKKTKTETTKQQLNPVRSIKDILPRIGNIEFRVTEDEYVLYERKKNCTGPKPRSRFIVFEKSVSLFQTARGVI